MQGSILPPEHKEESCRFSASGSCDGEGQDGLMKGLVTKTTAEAAELQKIPKDRMLMPTYNPPVLLNHVFIL